MRRNLYLRRGRSLSILTAAIESLESRRLLAAHGSSSIVPDGAPLAGSTTKLAASPTVSAVGTPVTLTATVTSPAGTVNLGSVTFKYGTTVLGSPIVDGGTASIMTSALPAGTDTVEADYSEGTFFAPSSDTTTETVGLVVSTTQDNTTPPSAGSLSLREAINLANQATSAQTITFDPTVFATPQTISLTLGELEITNNVTIDGPPVGVTVSRDTSKSDFRIFELDSNVTASMNLLTITDGVADGNGGGILTDSGSALTLTNSFVELNYAQGKLGSGDGFGGGIDAAGALTIADCLFESNSVSVDGGAIEQEGMMSLINSTFQGNTAVVGGGAIDNESHATITNCTIAGNSAGTGAGIFVNAGGVLTLNNTIISNTSEGHDLTGGTATGSNNLIADGSSSNTAGLTNTFTGDPDLNAPADNGGPTFTMSLQGNSPAIDKGSNALAVDQNNTALSFDARGTGFPRIQGSSVDIGAYEVQVPATVSSVSSTTANGAYGVGSVVTLTVGFSKPVNVTGTPDLALNSGGTASYSGGSGNSTLTFTYTVGAGQNANPLDESSTTALTLNGGTIKNVDNNNAATLTLPAPGAAGSLGANKSIAVDTVAPGVANITSTTANGTYGVGAVITIQITFNKAVVVTGTPAFALNSGGTASYSSGSGTSTLTFTYTVGSGQTATKLDEVSTTSLSLNGGTIFDTDNNPNAANLTLPAPGTSGSLGANKSIRIAVAESPSMVVTTTSDVVDQFDGLTSLREAVAYANTFPAQQVITFDPSLAGETIKLGIDGDDTYGASALAITGQVIIDGLTGSSGITIARDTAAAPNRLRLFYVAPGASLALQDLTISGGLAKGGSSQGGGGGAGLGGAILDAGTLTVISCTFESNEATGGNSTTGNSDTGGGGGLGGDGSGTDGGGPNGGTLSHINGGFGGGGEAVLESSAGAGGFGGGGGEVFGGAPGAGGFGGGAGASDPTGGTANGGFGGGTDNKNFLGGGGAGMGGAIFSNGGAITIVNSTFTGNTASGGTGANPGSGFGGAIFNRDGTLKITNSTLSADSANQGGIEVYSLGDGDHSGGDPVTANSASAVINNSILAQAVDPNADTLNPDFVSNTNDSGTSTSAGTNDLFNATTGFGGTVTDTKDPMLAGITNNGGPTSTMALEPNSPAIDKGSNALAKLGEPLAFDQRGAGFARVMGSSVDIGAFEVQVPATVASVSSTASDITFGVGGIVNVTVTFNEIVNVTGTPLLALNSGGTASYTSGTGTDTLTFTYEVAAGENASPLDEASTSALTLNGGTIDDTGGNAVTLTLPTPGTASSLSAADLTVDTTAPNVTSFDPGTSAGSVNSEIDYTITFNKAVMGAVSTDFDNTGTAPVTIGTISGNGTATLTVPVTPTGAGTIVLEINSADITDLVLNKLVVPVVDTHTVTVGVPNHAPTNISLTPNSIPENSGANALVGKLSDTDPDAGDTASFKLVSGTGSDNNTLFTISGNKLFAKVSFDYETKNTYSIRVKAFDSGGLTVSKVLTINILNVNEAPLPKNDATATAPDRPVTINVLVNDSDPDGDTLSLVNNTKPANGTVTVSGNKYIYTPNTGFHGIDSFVYRVRDPGGLTATATVTIDVESGVGVGKDPQNPSITDLDVVGTSVADNIKLVYGGSQGKVQVFFGSTNKGTFNFTGNILVYGQGGNDTITIDPRITRSAYVWGDNGNDTINGGGGNDFIFGGNGDDSVNGNAGRDILIGDDGADKLNGGAGDDLLIAGDFTTTPTTSQFASIQKEWDRTDKSYSSRVKDLTNGGGFNSIKLSSTTLFSSTTLADSLTGGSDSDLFFAAMTGDKITDKASGETAVNIGKMA